MIGSACHCGGTIFDSTCDRCGPTKRTRQARHRKGTRKIYNRRWEAFRSIVGAERRWLCERCKDEGKLVVGKELHHITPLADGGAKHDRDNVELLCKSCHSRETSTAS